MHLGLALPLCSLRQNLEQGMKGLANWYDCQLKCSKHLPVNKNLFPIVFNIFLLRTLVHFEEGLQVQVSKD